MYGKPKNFPALRPEGEGMATPQAVLARWRRKLCRATINGLERSHSKNAKSTWHDPFHRRAFGLNGFQGGLEGRRKTQQFFRLKNLIYVSWEHLNVKDWVRNLSYAFNIKLHRSSHKYILPEFQNIYSWINTELLTQGERTTVHSSRRWI